MWLQLRRDPVMGMMALVWGGVVALNAGLIAGLITTWAAGSGSHTPESLPLEMILTGLLWFSISFFLLFGKARERCHPLDLALPIPASRLWLAHAGALILLAAAYLAGSLAMFWVLFWVFRNAPVDFVPLKQALSGLILPVLVSLILTVVLMQQAGASQSRIPRSHGYVLSSVFLWGFGFGLSLLLSRLPAPVALLPLGLGFLLAWRTCRTLPPSLVWSPEIPARAADDAIAGSGSRASEIAEKEWETEDGKGIEFKWRIRWFLVRLLYLNPVRTRYACFFFIPWFFLWGFLMSGFFNVAYNLELPQLAYSVLSGFLLLSYLPSQLPQLRFVDVLPVSRKRVAVFLLVPALLTFAAGLGAGTLGAMILQRYRLQLQFQKEGSSYFPPYPEKTPVLRIPSRYGEISWDGNPGDIVAPWGESHPVWKYRLVPGSSIAVYSPFSTPQESSPRFIAFQISRAIETIYGVSIPYQEILDRYLEVSPDGTVAFPHPERLLSDYPRLTPRDMSPLAPLLLILTGVVYTIMASVYFRFWRGTVSEARTKAVYIALAVAAVAVTAIQVGFMVAGWIRPDVGAAFIRILLFRQVQAVPAGNLLAWILCALILLACFLLQQRELGRVEVLPSRMDRSSL